jgi:hypothetical protein
MKTLINISIAILLPILAFTQVQNVPSVSLKTLDEKTVLASNIVKGDELTLIYFFNENSKDLTDHLEYLENLAESYDNTGKVKVVAIYNASNGTYGQLKPFLHGNDIDVEAYIDLNGELQRAMGLQDNSTVLICGSNPELSVRFSEAPDFTDGVLNRQVSQLLCDYYSNDDAGKGAGVKSAAIK